MRRYNIILVVMLAVSLLWSTAVSAPALPQVPDTVPVAQAEVPQLAAVAGSVLCLSTSSASGTYLLWEYVEDEYPNQFLYRGWCSGSGVRNFYVKRGQYCISQWGGVYDGPGWATVQQWRKYYFSSAVKLVLRCYFA
jgi:hypothetical protein